MKTTAVCFDLDGTLVQYERGFDAILESVFESELGTATEAMTDAYSEGFFAAFDSLEAEPYHAGVRAAVDAEGIDAEDGEIDDLVAALRDAEFAATRVPAAARDCLAELGADEATTVVICSDGVGEWQRAKIAHHDLEAAVDETVISYDVGGHKTSGKPYDAVRDRVDADEYVMVGDSYESDVTAAREAGFSPIYYEDADPDLFETFGAML